jgi:hypothetical protein
MRTFTGGDGTDTTTAAIAFLKSGKQQFAFADLWLIGELEDPNALFLTDWQAPLSWPVWGKFIPSVLERDGITSQVGFEVTTLTLTWEPPIGTFAKAGQPILSASPYQLAQNGYYDNKRVRLWRALMPNEGDANTYGACEFFGGWIAESTIVRGKIVFKINSFLNVVNQLVPPNVIDSQNARAGWAGATPVLADSETSLPTFTVAAPSSANVILGDCIQPTANKIYGLNKFANGFMVFMPGSTLEGFFALIGLNSDFNAGGGTHYNQFNVYQSFPFDPSPGDTFYVSTEYPVNQDDATAVGAEVDNFIYVPDPETAI